MHAYKKGKYGDVAVFREPSSIRDSEPPHGCHHLGWSLPVLGCP